MKNNLTERQQNIFDYLLKYIAEHGHSPSFREIGERFEIKSTNGVRDNLIVLERKGVIKRNVGQTRCIEIVGAHWSDGSQKQSLQIPLVGQIAAGTPILAEENIEEYLTVDSSFAPRNSQAFALRVRGESMIGDGILNGDIAIIRTQKNAERGQIIAARRGSDATLKHYHPHPTENYIELRMSNPSPQFKPIIITQEDDFSIDGILCGIVRRVK
ncbi:LexA repressor [Fibrobacterales bacterium]|nr:LexA repressor [Fibrobacterales bacterium]